jgi:transposase InsO family protein
MAKMVLEHVENLKAEVLWPYERLCEAFALPYSTLMRYRHRIARREPALYTPGPRKIVPLDIEKLIDEIVLLSHARERSLGAAQLYTRYRDQISRRELGSLVELTRQEVNRERKAHLRRVSWEIACLVWSMDEVELRGCGSKFRLNQIQDLGSRYKFSPLVAEQITAEKVAAQLEELFGSYGAPLVLKRDNGPALNGQAVNAVLGKHLVIPLNSPSYYPPYNGGMERAQRELKERLLQKLTSLFLCDCGLLKAYGEAAANELNHNRRRSLKGQSSCEVFQAGKGALKTYNRRKRKEVFDWITELAVKIMESMEVKGQRQADAAWRIAVERWLQRNGIITVSHNKSVTQFSRKFVS